MKDREKILDSLYEDLEHIVGSDTANDVISDTRTGHNNRCTEIMSHLLHQGLKVEMGEMVSVSELLSYMDHLTMNGNNGRKGHPLYSKQKALCERMARVRLIMFDSGRKAERYEPTDNGASNE